MTWTFCRVTEAGVVYPFDLADLRAEGILVGPRADPRSLAALGVHHVHIDPEPAPEAGKVWEADTLPSLRGGFWRIGWTMRDPTPEELDTERAAMVVDRLTGRMVLGEAICAQLDGISNSPQTPFALRESIKHARRWRRTSPDMAVLAAQLGFSPEQMDDLFRQGMAMEAQSSLP